MSIKERMTALRAEMRRHETDAYIVTGSDAHLSEYVPAEWKTREYLSGFTGSAGTLVITAAKAGLWTDSRYFLQAAIQLKGTGIELYRTGLPDSLSIGDFLLEELSPGEVVGLDGRTYSAAASRSLRSLLHERSIALDTSVDLFEEIWKDRPSLTPSRAFEMPSEIAGQTVASKLEAVNSMLRSYGADGVLLCALDEVAWTFNIRGKDIEYNPLVIAYAFVSEKESFLFINADKLTKDIADSLISEGVTIAAYDMVTPYLGNLPAGFRLMTDMNSANATLFDAIPPHCRIVESITPANRLKSVKNPVEIEGFRKAVVRDGLALVHFHIWLEQQLETGSVVTEISAADTLSAMRAGQDAYVSDSFNTICGYAAHGAIVHYAATPDIDAVIRPEGLLLMDSGGHYIDGTTDITRTISLSAYPAQEVKEDFTLVLKGHIALATCNFPAGTRGSQLDILARKALWDAGLNYRHGTGHGIGHCLCVHEGPQSVRMEENPEPLLPGMIISNEPGLYREGRYGIRTENIMLVRLGDKTVHGDFLYFETLTLCHIDTRLVDTRMLTRGEREWLNKYNGMVYDNLSPLLNPEECQWLKAKTKAI